MSRTRVPQDGEALMANDDLRKARKSKSDEFYTQFHDIELEVNAYLDYNPDVFRGKTVLLPCDDPESSQFTKYFALNFEALGLKKLISTSFAHTSKHVHFPYQLSLFERDAEQFDPSKTETHGKIFVLEKDLNHDGRLDGKDLDWDYLKGDGDFRSDEVKALRDEADIIVTNPPFSLFREFFAWILEGKKQFLIIGNVNAITYKEVFPKIQENLLWLGESIHSGDREFGVPEDYPLNAAGSRVDAQGRKFIRVKGVRWFTNLDHGRRHTPLALMSKEDNLRYSKHKELQGKPDYEHYDNYDAIEVPYVDAIPSDYEGWMGVPITFLDKYCPEQFEIIGMAKRGAGDPKLKSKVYTSEDYPNYSDLNAGPALFRDGILRNTFPRILIRHRRIEG